MSKIMTVDVLSSIKGAQPSESVNKLFRKSNNHYEFDEKIKYAQNIINILQTRLNESVAQNVQLEATVTVLKEKVEQSKQEPINADSPKTEEK